MDPGSGGLLEEAVSAREAFPDVEHSRGLKKCMEASEWCREAWNVWKGIKFGNQAGAGKSQGRIPSGRRCKM